MEPKSKQSSVATAFAVEGVIVVVLVVAILITLNYFGIVPLSKTFGFLSFLPSQTAVNIGTTPPRGTGPRPGGPGTAQRGTSKAVIQSGSPLVIDNTTAEFKSEPIKNGFINPRGELTIETELTVGKAGGGTGLVFTNGLAYTDSNRRALSVFYYPKQGNWLIEYRANNKSDYRGIDIKEKSIKLKMVVGPLGKSVLVTSGSKGQNFQFPNSLYDGGKQMRMNVQVGPNSDITVKSLTYN